MFKKNKIANANILFIKVPHHHPWPESNALGEAPTTHEMLDTNLAPTGSMLINKVFPFFIDVSISFRSQQGVITVSQPCKWF